jgi:primary-amine oxidase
MSTESSIPSAAAQGAVTMHPLAALSAEELKIVSGLIKGLYPSTIEINFKVLTLKEPPKEQVLSYLEAEHAGGDALIKHAAPDRRAWVNYYIKNTARHIQRLDLDANWLLQSKFHEATVNITGRKVEQHVLLGANIHAPGDGAEIIAMEQIALADESVRAEIKKLKLPEGAIVMCDPWIYGKLLS